MKSSQTEDLNMQSEVVWRYAFIKQGAFLCVLRLMVQQEYVNILTLKTVFPVALFSLFPPSPPSSRLENTLLIMLVLCIRDVFLWEFSNKSTFPDCLLVLLL